MTEISAQVVKQLRDATNVSMMECKKALTEAGGDMEKATRILRERGMSVAAKKSARATNQGLIASASSPDGTIVSLVEVMCETDFAARNEAFKSLVNRVAASACEADGPVAEAVKDAVTETIAKTGENTVVRRNTRFVLQGAGRVAAYIHLGGKVGVLAELACAKPETAANPLFAELARDITLQVAAATPRFLHPQDVDEATLATEREIYAAQVKDKPAAVVAKIVEGKIKKFYGDVCLIEQAYIRDPKVTIRQLLATRGKELGDTPAIRRFVRYQLGE